MNLEAFIEQRIAKLSKRAAGWYPVCYCIFLQTLMAALVLFERQGYSCTVSSLPVKLAFASCFHALVIHRARLGIILFLAIMAGRALFYFYVGLLPSIPSDMADGTARGLPRRLEGSGPKGAVGRGGAGGDQPGAQHNQKPEQTTVYLKTRDGCVLRAKVRFPFSCCRNGASG